MNVKPAIRLILLVLIVLIQFFLIINYTNSLAGKNVELTRLQSQISKENRSQGEYKETIAQSLNETIVAESRTENIKRISPDETIKLRDLQPAQTPAADPTKDPGKGTNIVAY
jgi:cell division protein FtsL